MNDALHMRFRSCAHACCACRLWKHGRRCHACSSAFDRKAPKCAHLQAHPSGDDLRQLSGLYSSSQDQEDIPGSSAHFCIANAALDQVLMRVTRTAPRTLKQINPVYRAWTQCTLQTQLAAACALEVLQVTPHMPQLQNLQKVEALRQARC